MTPSLSIDLRCCDAFGASGLSSLADRSVDHVLCDPPFDEHTHRLAQEGERRDGHRTAGGTLPFAPFDDETIYRVAAELVRVTERWIAVFCADRQMPIWQVALEKQGARFIRFGLSIRTNPKPQLTGDRPAQAFDPIVIAYNAKGKPHWNAHGRAGAWYSPPARLDLGGQQHPTQKPLPLMRQLIEDFTKPGELILDPFAGSGTTAVACKELGRRFIGFESTPAYHAIALSRLARIADSQEPSTNTLETSTAEPSTEATEPSTSGRERTCKYCERPLESGLRRDAAYHRTCRELAYRERARAQRGGKR